MASVPAARIADLESRAILSDHAGMDPNRDSHRTQTGRISIEDWMRITAACATRHEAPASARKVVRRLQRPPARPLTVIAVLLCLSAAFIAALLLWQ